MPNARGFVEGVEIGRAGLASAFLIHADGTRATYTIADLDADPERFNERLSKLGLLRDAMDRAEPVEVEFESEGDRSGQIVRVRRLARDALAPISATSTAAGSVIGVGVVLRTAPENPDPSDQATLALLVGSSIERYVIDLQTPERGTAEAMVDMARAAQAAGAMLQVQFEIKSRRVVSLETGGDGRVGGGESASFAGFVETIAHLPVTDMMIVSVTTAPPFTSPGNLVELAPFDPELRHLLVLRGSPEYALLEAALRDTRRVEVLAETRNDRDGTNDDGSPDDNDGNAFGDTTLIQPTRLAPLLSDLLAQGPYALVRGARLCASLCSASRPVWIRIDRQALDIGPDGACVAGLPTSDLTPRGLREVNLPYRAEWIALGCFNHGIYRFEITSSAEFELFVDDVKLCLFKDEQDQAWFGHACLEGDHEVKIAFANWSCSATFDIDAYRIR